MNLIEAIKSGKRFKRPIHFNWKTTVNMEGDIGWTSENGFLHKYNPDVEDLLADDWETNIIKKELTAEDIVTAFAETTSGSESENALGKHLSRVLKHLGLE